MQHRDYAIVTIHREENTDDGDRLHDIILALKRISKKIPLVWPVHPRTRRALDRNQITIQLDNFPIIQIDPVGYCDMIELIRNCCLVLTDSGGLQKEAYFFKKPCVTMRTETEWIELADHGLNRIVGSKTADIVKAAYEMLDADLCFDQELYGCGDAAEKIVSILDNGFK